MNKELKRPKLPNGVIAAVGRKCELNPQTVSQILQGKRTSPRKAEIINALADAIAERKEAERQAIERLSSLLNN